MRSNRFVIFGLGLLIVALAGFAWHQSQELAIWRSAGLSNDERAALEARLEQYRKRNFELQSQLAALQLDRQVAEEAAAASAGDRSAERERGEAAMAKLADLAARDADAQSRKDEKLEMLAAMADLPEFQKLLALEQRGKIDAKYAALFRRLKLTPDEQAKLATLLADKQSAYADATIAARGQGLTGKDAKDVANTIAKATQKEIDASIKDLLGQQRFGQYQNYERTQPQRDAVNQLAQSLSYTATPLSLRQQEQLVQVLATTAATSKTVTNPSTGATTVKTKPAEPIAPLPGTLANLGIASAPSAPITPAAIAQAQSFLAPQQTAALLQMQQQQQAQQMLNQALNGKPAAGASKMPDVVKTPKTPKPGT